VVVEDERRREIGLFRYALIRPAVEPGLSKAERGRLVRALAEAEHLGRTGGLFGLLARRWMSGSAGTVAAGLRRCARGCGA
jgi:hypothetical protein